MPGNGKANIRKPDTSLPDDSAVDFEKLLKDTCPATGDRYLVVGTGFLGSKLIHALLLRGEKHVRAFDIDPNLDDLPVSFQPLLDGERQHLAHDRQQHTFGPLPQDDRTQGLPARNKVGEAEH